MNDLSDTLQDNPPKSEESPSMESLGQRLREAREARGLSRQDAATRLRLQVKLVRALEEDDNDSLPPPAFVVGYLRSYARLLGLAEDEVLAAYRAQGDTAPPPIMSNVHRHAQPRATDLPVRLVTYGLIGGLGVLLTLWWLSHGRESARLPEEPPAPAGLVQSVPGGGTAPEDTPPAHVEALPAAPVTHAEALAPAPPVVEHRAEPEPPPVADEPSQQPAPAVAAPPAEAAQPEGPPPLTPQMPQSTLELKFSADSWTEVHDAAGRRLLYDLVPQGRTVTLHGQAPFKVFLGYAPGVAVELNGRPFDHSRYQRQDVARFQVGRSGDNAPLASGE